MNINSLKAIFLIVLSSIFINCNSINKDEFSVSELVLSPEFYVEQTSDSSFFSYILDIESDLEHIYIPDVRNNRIMILRENDFSIVAEFGNYGMGPGELNSPIRIKVIRDSIYVMDNQLRRMNVFNNTGVFARRFFVPSHFYMNKYAFTDSLIYLPSNDIDTLVSSIKVSSFSGSTIKEFKIKDDIYLNNIKQLHINQNGELISLRFTNAPILEKYELSGEKLTQLNLLKLNQLDEYWKVVQKYQKDTNLEENKMNFYFSDSDIFENNLFVALFGGKPYGTIVVVDTNNDFKPIYILKLAGAKKHMKVWPRAISINENKILFVFDMFRGGFYSYNLREIV